MAKGVVSVVQFTACHGSLHVCYERLCCLFGSSAWIRYLVSLALSRDWLFNFSTRSALRKLSFSLTNKFWLVLAWKSWVALDEGRRSRGCCFDLFNILWSKTLIKHLWGCHVLVLSIICEQEYCESSHIFLTENKLRTTRTLETEFGEWRIYVWIPKLRLVLDILLMLFIVNLEDANLLEACVSFPKWSLLVLTYMLYH